MNQGRRARKPRKPCANLGGLRALACVVGASRILFALGRDTGPAMLATTTRAGAPAVALTGDAAGSLLTLLLVLHEDLATQAVAVSLGYGADPIIAAYARHLRLGAAQGRCRSTARPGHPPMTG